MKILILSLITLSLSSMASAVTFEITNLCKPSPYFSQEVVIEEESNVSIVTHNTLSENNIPYVGGDAGINTMLDTPVEFDAYEILSDTHMRAYGWCFKVDGESPTLFMNQIPVTKNTKKIQWFYGYAEFIQPDWISYCVPLYEDPRPFLCK
jgi:hypothetical protein